MARITYNSINIDLSGWTDFQVTPRQRRFVSQSDSGKVETYNFYNQKFIEANRNNWTPEEKEQLRAFFEYARDGSTFSIERDRNLGCAISFEGKSLKTNDGTDGTFTRTHVANADSYLNRSSGLLEYAGAADTPRHPAGKYGDGVLIEGARINYCGRSESFAHADWVDVGTSITQTDGTSDTLDPFGGSNASKIEITSAGGVLKYVSGQAGTTTDSVFSLWMKNAVGDESNIDIGISDDSSTKATNEITMTPDWQRFNVAYNNPGGGGGFHTALIGTDVNQVATFYVYGAQLEVAAANLLFPSQYIQSDAGGTVTRNLDLLRYPAANIVNQEKGTIAFWMKNPYAGQSSSGHWVFNSGTDGTNQHIGYYHTTTSHQLRMDDGSGTVRPSVGGALAQTADTWHHYVIVYDAFNDTHATRNLLLYVDGTLFDDNGATAPFNPDAVGTNFSFGCNTYDNSAVNYAMFDDIIIRKDVKDATWVSEVYNGLRKYKGQNRFSSVRLTDPDDAAKWILGDLFEGTIKCEEVL